MRRREDADNGRRLLCDGSVEAKHSVREPVAHGGSLRLTEAPRRLSHVKDPALEGTG